MVRAQKGRQDAGTTNLAVNHTRNNHPPEYQVGQAQPDVAWFTVRLESLIAASTMPAIRRLTLPGSLSGWKA